MAAPWIRHGYYKQHLRFSIRLVGFLRRFVSNEAVGAAPVVPRGVQPVIEIGAFWEDLGAVRILGSQ